jgi:hypothetical protein
MERRGYQSTELKYITFQTASVFIWPLEIAWPDWIKQLANSSNSIINVYRIVNRELINLRDGFSTN